MTGEREEEAVAEFDRDWFSRHSAALIEASSPPSPSLTHGPLPVGKVPTQAPQNCGQSPDST